MTKTVELSIRQPIEPSCLQNFMFKENEVRVITENGEPWFVGKDVCAAFGDLNPNRTMQRVDTEDKMIREILDSMGRKRETIVINESGLYSLLFSMQPQKTNKKDWVSDEYPIETKKRIDLLREFKHWVTSEVLPTIRKTGGYVFKDDQFISIYLPNADEQTKLMFKTTLQTVRNLNAKIEEDKPKVFFADTVTDADGDIKVGDMARILTQAGYKINQNDFFAWLREHKYLLIQSGSKNLPSQFSIKNNLMKIKERTFTTKNNRQMIGQQPMITGKGQQYFIGRLIHNKPVSYMLEK